MSEAATIPVPVNDQEKVKSVVSLSQEYENFDIKTHEDCEFAALTLVDIRKSCKALEARRLEITQPMDVAKKSVMALFKPASDAYDKLEKIMKPKILKYNKDQEKKQAIADAAAAEKARKEREALEAKAKVAKKKGNKEKAEELTQRSVSVVSRAPALAQKVAGVSTQKKWVAEVEDIKKVCAAIAAGDIPSSVIEFKKADLNRFAATWQDTKKFSGLRIFQDSVVRTR